MKKVMKKTTTTAMPHNKTFLPEIAECAAKANQNAKVKWLNSYRQNQIEQLAKTSFPTSRTEHFKYNNLGVFDVTSFNKIASKSTDSIDVATRKIAGLETDQSIDSVIFINGIFSAELSKINHHMITSFAYASDKQQKTILAQLNEQNSGEATLDNNPFTKINASLLDDGILIEVTPESPDTIIEVLNIVDSQTCDSTLASQVMIDVAENSKATVVSRSLNWDLNSENINLSTQQTLARIGNNAELTHYCLLLENTNSVSFVNNEYNLHSRSTLNAFYGATGSIIKKMDVTVNHLGEYAHAYLNGLYAATGNEQIDYHTTINHPKPNGTTNEVFRGIVNDKAEATFNGRIHIFEDAQKTLAELSNKNLVLSDDAVLHTKPELEIYADDVICAHGATVSRMEKVFLDYFRARGISKAEAELMLSYGFFNEVLNKLEHSAIANYLRPILFKRLD